MSTMDAGQYFRKWVLAQVLHSLQDAPGSAGGHDEIAAGGQC
jgi:prophage antirepressor-like protein